MIPERFVRKAFERRLRTRERLAPPALRRELCQQPIGDRVLLGGWEARDFSEGLLQELRHALSLPQGTAHANELRTSRSRAGVQHGYRETRLPNLPLFPYKSAAVRSSARAVVPRQ